MNNSLILAGSIGTVLLALATTTPTVAQTTTDSPQRVEIKRADLAGAPGMEVIVSTAEYKPGETLPVHFHHGTEVAYIVQGATVQIPGQPPRALPSGASVMNQRDIRHGGFTVVGDTSLKLLTVHVVDKGAPLFDSSNPSK